VAPTLKTVSDSDPLWQQIRQYVRLMNTHSDTVEIDNGIEKPGGKDTTPWGRNGLVNSMLPFLPLNLLTSEAVSSGNPKVPPLGNHQRPPDRRLRLRVDKKKSHYAINYCCFPDTSSVGNVLYNGSGSQPVNNGNLSTVSDWKPFNAKSGYHGELFLDPDSGVVLRTIVAAEFKQSDFVHYENIRIDYAPCQSAARISTSPCVLSPSLRSSPTAIPSRAATPFACR
jgi:hypothetical protein